MKPEPQAGQFWKLGEQVIMLFMNGPSLCNVVLDGALTSMGVLQNERLVFTLLNGDSSIYLFSVKELEKTK